MFKLDVPHEHRNPCDPIPLQLLSSDEDDEVEVVDCRSSFGINNGRDENRNFDNVDPSLQKFIQLCLNIEQSNGMLRVINRSLLPLYQEANHDYKESAEFIAILDRTVRNIIKQPNFKFTYIRLLCANLKENKRKKRKSFVTIKTTVKRNRIKVCHNRKDTNNLVSSSDSDEVIIIDNDEKENDSNSTMAPSKLRPLVMSLQDSESKSQDKVVLDNTNGLDKDKHNQILSNFSHNATLHKEPTESSEQQIGTQENLLTAQRIEQHPDDALKVKIKSIEDLIAKLKEKIDELEEKEVCEDTGKSPYLLCDIYKAQVVDLYNDLCHLTNSPSVKRHEVRLSVLEGHSKEPVKILERFLNNNIQNNGYPAFPDFSDVKMCVVMANDIHKLGWDSKTVMKEARALFTQCGRALQKLRQNREWKDLLATIEHDDSEADPAQLDPELMAKLEANKARAIQKETDIIEKYASRNTKRAHEQEKCIDSNLIKNNNSNESDSESVILCEEDMIKNEEFFKRLKEMVKIEKPDAEADGDIMQKEEIKTEVKPECIVKEELEDLGDDFIVAVEGDNSYLVIEVSSDSDDDVEVL